jgi:intraflagellar transport protein 57
MHSATHLTTLQTGYGREICGVLDGLADYVLERRNFTYRKPLYMPDG